MAKKNKSKWNRSHKFMRKKSNRSGVGHPVYVYGNNKRAYKYLLFTHNPPEGREEEFELLKHNIDPQEEGLRSSYVKKQFQIDRFNAFEDQTEKYRIREDDRDVIKKYKK